MGKNGKNNEDEMVKLDGELNKVAGGIFNLDEDLDDGHEKSCFTACFHSKDECSASPDGYHHFYVVHEHFFGDTERCKYCGEETE